MTGRRISLPRSGVAWLRLSADGQLLYLTTATSVISVATSTMLQVDELVGPARGGQLHLTADGRRGYLAGVTDRMLWELELAPDGGLATGRAALALGAAPSGLQVDPAAGTAYVSTAAGLVSVDLATWTPSSASGPAGTARLDPRSGDLWVADGDELTVLAPGWQDDPTLVDPVETGTGVGQAVTFASRPDAPRLGVIRSRGGVLVLDLRGRAVLDEIPLGFGPSSAVIGADGRSIVVVGGGAEPRLALIDLGSPGALGTG